MEPKEIVNDTTNIFGKEYDIATGGESYNTLTLNYVAEFLGLEDCSVESVTNALQQRAISQIPTTTTIATELPTTTENFSTTTYFDNNENNCVTSENILIATGIGIAGITIGGILGYFVGKYQKQKNVINQVEKENNILELRNENLEIKNENLKLQKTFVSSLVSSSIGSGSSNLEQNSSNNSSTKSNCGGDYSDNYPIMENTSLMGLDFSQITAEETV